jgi:thiamine biosynthesis protein ThiS
VISLRVNGKPVELPGPTPLLDYVGRLGVDPRAIAVEVNGEILQRDGYADCTLADGDAVEIVRMVGGGADEHAPIKSTGERLAELIAAGEAEPAAKRTRTVPRPTRLPRGATVSDLVPEHRQPRAIP